jgi:electron transfer flavoprotein beta subunit
LGATPFDLILTGAQASDDGAALVGPALAELLGLPSAALVNKLEVSGDKAVCTRELEGGWGEVVELRLPALITIQTGINEPRYVSVLGIKKARSKPIDLLDLAQAGVAPAALGAAAAQFALQALEQPPAGGEAELLTGSHEEIAKRFVSILAEKGGVL